MAWKMLLLVGLIAVVACTHRVDLPTHFPDPTIGRDVPATVKP